MALERTFDVAVDCERFPEFIGELRGALRDPNRAAPFPNRHPDLYVLPQTTRGAPRQWLRLTMVAGNARVIVWIRTDNLYVMGFEHEVQGATRRYELGINPENDPKQKNKKQKDKDKKAKKKKKEEDEGEAQVQPLIPGATFLGFGGDYGDLGQLLTGPVPGTRTRPNLGRQQLLDAIRGLAGYMPRDPQMVGEVRNWLRTIVVTISESLRLHNVCEFIDGLLRDYTSGWLTQRLIDCIHGWDPISACVIASAADPEGDARGRYRHLISICHNTDQACEVVAILNTGTGADEPGPSHRRPRREAAPLLGLTFVEIFSAVVRCQGSSSSSSMGRNRNLTLYGHIAIADGLSSGGSSQLLFTRGRSNALLTPRADDGHVELTGPARAVWGYGEIVMRVDLMDAVPGFVADMTPDDEVGSGKLVWNTYDTPRMVYNEVEEYAFEGVSGAVNVRCAVITNAVVATVALRRTGSGRRVDVYGVVSATTPMFGPHDKVTLFDRVCKDAVSVGPGEDVALLRKVAVVPLRSLLRIRAILFIRSPVADMSPDEQISSGIVAEFTPVPFGVVRKVIGDGDVEVSVTWSLN